MNSALALAVASIFCNSYSFANFSKTLLQCSSLNALASMVMPRYFCLIAFSLCFCLNAFALRISWMIYLNAFASMPLPQCLCLNAFASMPHLKNFFNAFTSMTLPQCLCLNASSQGFLQCLIPRISWVSLPQCLCLNDSSQRLSLNAFCINTFIQCFATFTYADNVFILLLISM